MIDSITLTFKPKKWDEQLKFNKIMSLTGGKRKIELDKSCDLFIFHQGFGRYKGNKDRVAYDRCLQIKIYRAAEFIDKINILESDLPVLREKIISLISRYEIDYDYLAVTEIHYKVDLVLPYDELKQYLKQFEKARNTYYTNQKKVYYNKDTGDIDSVYYKGNSLNINIYDKRQQLVNKCRPVPDYLKNIFRIELQIQNRRIRNYCENFEMARTLDNLFNEKARVYFITNILIDKIIYVGDFYSLSGIKSNLNGTKNGYKDKILAYCKQVLESDVDTANGNYSPSTIRSYKKVLAENNINPIPLERLTYLKGIDNIINDLFKTKDKLIC